jgi:hypothetical protein
MNPGRPWLLSSLVAGVLVAGGCARHADEDDRPPAAAPAADAARPPELGPGVSVDATARERLGLVLTPVTQAQDASVADGVATVLDGAALAATLDDIAAARSDANSQAELVRRLQHLYDEGGNASLQALQAARAQLASARAKLTAAESRARADWGATLIDTTDAAARSALKDLARGQGALLRAEFPATLKGAPQLQYAIAAGESGFIPSHFIGVSRAPTLSAGGAAVTLAVSNKDAADLALRPGTRVRVIASAAQRSTQVIVPESAVIADSGALWCYVQRGAERFERVPVDGDHRVAAGYPAPLQNDDLVVTRGAPLLLSLERGAGAPAPADED